MNGKGFVPLIDFKTFNASVVVVNFIPVIDKNLSSSIFERQLVSVNCFYNRLNRDPNLLDT